MQVVVCKIKNCGFHGEHDFCLNRLVTINEQGVCRHLTRNGWEQPIDSEFKQKVTVQEEERI